MVHYRSRLEMNTDELDESVWVLTACHTEHDPVKEAEFVCPLQMFEQFSVVDFCVFFRVMWEHNVNHSKKRCSFVFCFKTLKFNFKQAFQPLVLSRFDGRHFNLNRKNNVPRFVEVSFVFVTWWNLPRKMVNWLWPCRGEDKHVIPP